MKIISVVGARPNFIKVAPLHRALLEQDVFESMIVHTGQHYDARMSEIFFRQLELPEPDVYLGVGSGSQARQTAAVMVAFEEVVMRERPDLVVVVGDVNSTVACSLVAAKCHIPIAHVEAGLRSGDRRMPEEINRIVTDSISDYLFVTEQSGLDNLRSEGVSSEKVFFSGNVMIDSLIHFREKARETSILSTLGLEDGRYILLTMHRPSNVDDEVNLREVAALAENLSGLATLVFPVHPRTRHRLESAGLAQWLEGSPAIRLIEPLGYLEFLRLMEGAAVVVTDSGGIQEETTFLRIPCITLRDSTERPVTVEIGTNELMELDADLVRERIGDILSGDKPRGEIPPLWDGEAARRIVSVLAERLVPVAA